MEVQIRNLSKNWQTSESYVERIIQTILDEEGETADEVSILFCDDEYMSELNEQYRDVDGATDVLAFAASEAETPPEVGCVSLGDIVVSVETAERQACESLEHELATLLVHGMLHLLGYDHGEPNEFAVMEEKQRTYVEAILSQDRQTKED
ncbi:rRNA maturation RNase YbeY [Candidatus Hydrogenedentota bacterium]